MHTSLPAASAAWCGLRQRSTLSPACLHRPVWLSQWPLRGASCRRILGGPWPHAQGGISLCLLLGRGPPSKLVCLPEPGPCLDQPVQCEAGHPNSPQCPVAEGSVSNSEHRRESGKGGAHGEAPAAPAQAPGTPLGLMSITVLMPFPTPMEFQSTSSLHPADLTSQIPEMRTKLGIDNQGWRAVSGCIPDEGCSRLGPWEPPHQNEPIATKPS